MRLTLRLAAWLLAIAGLVAGYAFLRQEKARQESDTHVVRPVQDRRLEIQRTLDEAARTINPKPTPTTLASLLAIPRPASLSVRAAPLETTVWKLTATVVEVVVREDGDIYLVLDDGRTRTVAEIPKAEHCAESPFRDEIARIRGEIERKLNPSAQPRSVKRRAELTGVGFFGKSNAKSNGARLLPLLHLRWLD